MKFPIAVKKISMKENAVIEQGFETRQGRLVKIRPCADEYGDKTYLGLYIGDVALGLSSSYDEKSGNLEIRSSFHNPAIFVFDLNKVIFGLESWWGVIENEKDLKSITNQDIENVWYVKAMKQLSDTAALSDEQQEKSE